MVCANAAIPMAITIQGLNQGLNARVGKLRDACLGTRLDLEVNPRVNPGGNVNGEPDFNVGLDFNPKLDFNESLALNESLDFNVLSSTDV